VCGFAFDRGRLIVERGEPVAACRVRAVPAGGVAHLPAATPSARARRACARALVQAGRRRPQAQAATSCWSGRASASAWPLFGATGRNGRG